MRFSKFACCFAILFSACTCFAQMYTMTDLGTLNVPGFYPWAYPQSLNNSGQVVGYIIQSDPYHAFRTAPNIPINLATDNLGSVLGSGWNTSAVSINNSGQVVGSASKSDGTTSFGFR